MDVKTDFLNGDLTKKIYMEKAEGLDAPVGKVCKLIKSLYGLKQASKLWHEKFDEIVRNNGYQVSESDKCLHIKVAKGKAPTDLISAPNAKKLEESFMHWMKEEKLKLKRINITFHELKLLLTCGGRGKNFFDDRQSSLNTVTRNEREQAVKTEAMLNKDRNKAKELLFV
ncbi:uncharacterized protein LOC109846912 [Asparagus officinalis]|uniref:uncharacterized protein LOC109846912 n=1 Tax=Asparagus officinalis TaxID=4686 RepID=UPI00098E37B6|nr:uncharacterized protein LOC109846912 [Asparagus officinalis]